MKEKRKRRPRSRLGCALLLIFGVLFAVWIGSGLERDRAAIPTLAVLPSVTVPQTSTKVITAVPSETATPALITVITAAPTRTATTTATFTPSLTFTPSTTIVPTAQVFPTLPPAQPSTRVPAFSAPTRASVSPYTCNGVDDLNCADFDNDPARAQAHLDKCGNEDRLDGDEDGWACEPTNWDN